MELSLCMIVRDEEGCLEQCLSSVRDAVDEIIIVDTGSSDATKEIAARYTDRIYEIPWEEDFAKARNTSMRWAEKPFILWLDADDVLDPPEREKLIALKARLDDSVDAVMLPYHYAFSEDGRTSLVFSRERIVRRAAGFSFSGAVHEVMAVSGRVIQEDIVIRHTGRHAQGSNARNLRIYERQMAEGRKMTARDMYYYARELGGAGEYERALQAMDGFLKMDGWIENRIDAHIRRGEWLRRLGRREEARQAYLCSMALRAPCAEALCAMGELLLDEGDLAGAAFWYGTALLCVPDGNSGAFVSPDAYGYIPLMQLCVIYDRMGECIRASQMNERALLIRPNDAAAMRNREYFRKKLKK